MISSNIIVNTKLKKATENQMEHELKQIGPRIRVDIYNALIKECARTRQSQAIIVEQALIRLLKDAGHDIEDFRGY